MLRNEFRDANPNQLWNAWHAKVRLWCFMFLKRFIVTDPPAGADTDDSAKLSRGHVESWCLGPVRLSFRQVSFVRVQHEAPSVTFLQLGCKSGVPVMPMSDMSSSFWNVCTSS